MKTLRTMIAMRRERRSAENVRRLETVERLSNERADVTVVTANGEEFHRTVKGFMRPDYYGGMVSARSAARADAISIGCAGFWAGDRLIPVGAIRSVTVKTSVRPGG